MREIIYTTVKQDVWVKDIEDLLGALQTFWKPYLFDINECEEVLNIILILDGEDAENFDEFIFKQVCEIVIISVQMWIEGHTVGKFKA